MKKFFTLLVMALMAVGVNAEEADILSKFTYTWDAENESFTNNADGTITYNGKAWGGLAAWIGGEDWSSYSSLTFEFSEATTVDVQIAIGDLKKYGNAGVTKLTFDFDGSDVSKVQQVALQLAAKGSVTISRVYLTNAVEYYATALWEDECAFGNWANGFNIAAEKFANAAAGDILEFVYTTDATTATYWQFKTNFGGTETTLSSNASDLNEWGCATVQKDSKTYRITLNAEDIAQLKEKGIYVGGYYCVVTKVNLVKEVTWTVAGGKNLFGSEWNTADANNDMISTDGKIYTWVKEDVTLEKGTEYKFKVAKNHSWGEAYPSSDYIFKVDETAKYTITITFDSESKEVSVKTEKTGDAEAVEHTYDVRGNFKGDEKWEISYEMTKGSDGIFTVSIADVDKGNYEYKVRQDNAWSVSYPSSNATVEVKENGSTVTITFDPSTNTVNATVTAPTGITAVKTAQQDGVRYNLAGQKVNAGYKGVVIMNGKKFVVK